MEASKSFLGSDCMNFVRARASSKEAHLKHANIILAAITDVIDTQHGGKRSAAAYFGAIMTALDQKEKHTIETVGAFAYLLSVAFANLPPSVMRSKCEAISDTFLDLLKEYADDAHTTKSILLCAGELLKNLESGQWSMRSALKMLQALLVFAVDPRPKIRKVAQRCLQVIFVALYQSELGLPKQVVEYLVSVCDQEIAQCTMKENQVVLYLCGLLQLVVPVLPLSVVSSLTLSLLPFLQGNQVAMNTQILRVLTVVAVADVTSLPEDLNNNAFPTASPSSSSHDSVLSNESTSAVNSLKKKAKVAAMIEAFLAALLKRAPHVNAVELALPYFETVHALLARLSRADAGMAHRKLSTFLSLMTDFLLSGKPEVVNGASKAMQLMLTTVWDDAIVDQGLIALSSASSSSSSSSSFSSSPAAPSPIASHLATLQSLLGFRYKAVFTSVFAVLRTALLKLPARALSLCVPLLQSMDALYTSDDTHQSMLEEVFGAAVASFEPSQLLTVIPLNLPTAHALKQATASVSSSSSSSLRQMTPFNTLLLRSRSWLLPLMMRHIRYAQLEYVCDVLLPMADELFAIAAHIGDDDGDQGAHGQEQEVEDQKNAVLLAEQIYACLPQFCHLPTDVATKFKPLAKKLAAVLAADEATLGSPLIKACVCKGLTALIAKNQAVANGTYMTSPQNKEDVYSSSSSSSSSPVSSLLRKPCPVTADEANANLVAIGKFAGNFLPHLFNAVTAADTDKKEIIGHVAAERAAVLDAIAAYCSIADAKTNNKLFQLALKKYLENITAAAAAHATKDGKQKSNGGKGPAGMEDGDDTDKVDALTGEAKGLADVVMAMVPVLDSANATLLFRSFAPQLSERDSFIQKKAYRVCSVLFANNQEFFAKNWPAMADTLASSLGAVTSAAMKARLECITALTCQVPNFLSEPKILSVLPSLLGEAILATKEVSRKTRDAAYELLIALGRKMLATELDAQQVRAVGLNELSSQSARPLMAEYVCMITAGLAGSSPHMKSATVLALARLLYEFKSEMPGSLVADILSTVTVLLDSKARELVKSVLGFVKVAAIALDKETLQPQLPELIKGLTVWSEESKNRFRQKVKVIFELLIKKFGANAVKELVPPSHTKLIEHIRKQKEREGKKKLESWKEKQNEKYGGGKNKGGTNGDDDDMDQDGDGEDRRALSGPSAFANNAVKAQVKAAASYEDVLYGDSDEEDSDGEEEKVDSKGKNKGGKPANNARGGGMELDDSRGSFKVKGDTDFMDAGAVKNLNMPSNNNKKRGRDNFDYDEFGKIKVVDSSSSSASAPGMLKAKRKGGGNDVEERKKAAHANDDDDDGEDGKDDEGRDVFGGNKKRQKTATGDGAYTGQAYKSERAGGDVLRKGAKFEPFAYMALDPKQMNKRNIQKNVRDLNKFMGNEAGHRTMDDSGAKVKGTKFSRAKRQAMKKKGGRFPNSK